MECVPDACEAKKQWHYLYGMNFFAYSKAYINTNEDLHTSMNFMPQNCNKALTVAASGDHPLFCSLYGAKHVDTFDISYNAKCIMDIKVAALSCLNRLEYFELLKDLQVQTNIKCVKHIEKIAKKLPRAEYKYLCETNGCKWFERGMVADDFFDNVCCVLSDNEYKKLQKIVTKPYNCTVTDIADLGEKLTENYDFMHFSNIFDYIPKRKRFGVLKPLLEHVNVGGRVVMHHMNEYPWKKSPIPLSKIFSKVFWDWRFIQTGKEISILERIR